ncbi:valine--tRNA ligase [Thermoflavifilum thermophilum]|nr:valine--tRNA ligase [Thermoflavifilum thermophilum]
MEIAKTYQHGAVEAKWYAHWLGKGYFHSTPDQRQPYTIVIPPPNVTGVLHMGHALNETIQDILIRRARAMGYNACWVPGADHASIATEARVVNQLKAQGIRKQDIGREAFLQHAWEWKEKYGGIIYEQLKKLGCSCDWQRTTFTLDDTYSRAVIRVFVQLYREGFIYRGQRMINWDPVALTALSDEEVEYREVQSTLFYVQYPLEGSTDRITVATTRPETILGDVAIAVHPEDPRYQHLIGKYAYVPLIDRRIPIIADAYVDQAFGTGCLKITPAHDWNDYQLGIKHQLPIIDVLNPDGTMSAAAQLFVGEDRFVVRNKIADLLREKGFLAKTETIVNKNGFSQRSNAVVEPRISTQWFLKMKDLAKPALDEVLQRQIQIHPEERFLNTYRHWMENVQDWCISRQLWWGHRIPAWYDAQGNIYVAETAEEAYAQAHKAMGTTDVQLHQDEDVLDTWFSSWLWPIQVFQGITQPGNAEWRYYYPTTVLVTGQDIIFFWVARMIMAGLHFTGEIPFRYVYFTGMVRDKLGRKMSKSLGNSPDLSQLIDQYGADAVRFGIMISSPAGNDLLFDEKGCEQGLHFCNKLWNALRLIKSWEPRINEQTKPATDFPIKWFHHRLQAFIRQTEKDFEQFRLSENLKNLYTLIWEDFCSTYLEWMKPAPDADGLQITKSYFETLLQLLHPYMPFITEEIYHQLSPRDANDDLIIKPIPAATDADEEIVQQGLLLKDVLAAVRQTLQMHQIKAKQPYELWIQTTQREKYETCIPILHSQLHVQNIVFTDDAPEQAIRTVVGKDILYIKIPELASTASDHQKQNLEKELNYLKSFLQKIEEKLQNERFLQHAKSEVVEREQKKKQDTLEKIRVIEETLRTLS